MKIVCISDTHKKHRELDLPEGDVLVFAGDMSGRGSLKSVRKFNRWLGEQPHQHKIVIAGNHDWAFQKQGLIAREEMTNAIYLEDTETVIDGVKFYGSPWQPEFCGWAFNLPRGELLKRRWEAIPDDTNVLITHSPPAGIADWSIYDDEHCGCEYLRTRVEQLDDMKLHVFGHIHHGYGMYGDSKMVYVNASSCDEGYNIVNPPIVVYV